MLYSMSVCALANVYFLKNVLVLMFTLLKFLYLKNYPQTNNQLSAAAENQP